MCIRDRGKQNRQRAQVDVAEILRIRRNKEGGDNGQPVSYTHLVLSLRHFRAFWGGVLSGIVEPIGAVLTILAAGIVVPALPYLLSFAAGAMLYVVVEELIPEMSQGQHSNVCLLYTSLEGPATRQECSWQTHSWPLKGLC